MLRFSDSMTPLVWVIAFALLLVRIGDAHVHLCFDGQEPRSSFHVTDDSSHHGSFGKSNGHMDTDVSLAGQVLSKAPKVDSDLPLFLAGALILWALCNLSATDLRPCRQLEFAPLTVFFLRPPLRGPPR